MKPHKREVVAFDVFSHQRTTIVQEFDEHGNHRLRYAASKRAGDWTTYQSISKLMHYRGCTEYWLGTLPRVFQIIPLKGKEK